MKQINNSETVIIKRSQILFAPYNPRKRSTKVVQSILKNFKKVGYLGGIVWNELTGYLVSGHKRVEASDIYYKFDGTSETDYDIKVEKVNFDEKTEKEQNIYMNASDSQGEFDFEKLAPILYEVDIDNIGFSKETIDQIQLEVPDFDFGNNTEIMNEFKTLKNRGLSEEEVKRIGLERRNERKQIQKERNDEMLEKPDLIITFEDFETKVTVLEHFKLDTYTRYAKGEKIFENIL